MVRQCSQPTQNVDRTKIIVFFQFFKYITACENVKTSLGITTANYNVRAYFHPRNGVTALRLNGGEFEFYLQEQTPFDLRSVLKKPNINYNRAMTITLVTKLP